MTNTLAPSRSVRPMPRVTPDEYREQQRELMWQLGDLELRADMEPYLANDPLARLGFDPAHIDWFSPNRRVTPFYDPDGTDLSRILFSDTLRRYNDMYPDRNGIVPPDTILANSYWGMGALAHEARHRGLQILRDLGIPDPDYADYAAMGRMVRPNEETVVEGGDLPFLDEVYPIPRGTVEFEHGYLTPSAMAETMGPGRRDDDGLQRYLRAYQDLAQEELTRRGEPPRTVPLNQEPEPEPRGGLLGLFDRIVGN